MELQHDLNRWRTSPRQMPWRENCDPYYILVSEIMLQQTQVARVEPKFREFIAKFSDVKSLANADLADVLRTWNGLGYNRRAKFLHDAAKMICENFGGEIPSQIIDLVKLPGVGPNTAGAIAVYAFNRAEIFVETNIRTVILHYFFADQHDVTDAEICEKLEQILDTDSPREFYWAMMDLGAELKSTIGNVSRRAKNYTKQSKFDGSVRQIRGEILRKLAERPMARTEILRKIDDERTAKIIDDLRREKLIHEKQGKLRLGNG